MLRFIARLIYIFLVMLETLLGIRFLFKLVNIPTTVPVANWVYMHTDKVLVWFNGAGLSSFSILGFFVETQTLLAIAVIAVINWALAEIIKVYNK